MGVPGPFLLYPVAELVCDNIGQGDTQQALMLVKPGNNYWHIVYSIHNANVCVHVVLLVDSCLPATCIESTASEKAI